MSPIQYLDFVCNQLPKETVEQSINVTLAYTNLCINRFIPPDKIKHYTGKLLDMCLQILSTKPEHGISGPINANMYNFIRTDEHATLAISWLNNGFVHTQQDPTTNLLELKAASKRQIVESLFELSCVS